MNTDDLSRDVARACPGDSGRLSQLHDGLAAMARQAGILDVAYRTIDSRVGELLLAATKRGLVRVGTACATNPLPVMMRCRRVVRSDGSMSSYLGGVNAKRTLRSPSAPQPGRPVNRADG